MPGQAGGDVPDASERVRVGVLQVRVVAEAPSSRVQAVRSAAMFAARTQPQLTCQVFDGKLRRPIDFAVRTPPVSTTACSRWTTSMYWGWWLPGTPPIPPSGIFVQVNSGG